MISLEYLDTISLVAWLSYEKLVALQEKFWVNMPVHWDKKKKRATPRTVRQCLPYLVMTALQVPIFLQTMTIFVWQITPKWAEPRYPFFAAITNTFGALVNISVTTCGVAVFFKRKQWCLCLNVVGEHRFKGGVLSIKTSRFNNSWTRKPIWKNITPLDLISESIVYALLALGTCGFYMVIMVDFDPIYYMTMDVPRGSLQWLILKFIIRPMFWGNWTMYCTLTFYHNMIGMFYFILHGCTVIPHVPKLSQNPESNSIIQNSLSNLTFSHKLTLQLLEGAYKEYRRFQVFIRPANDAMYFVFPISLAGLFVCSIAAGVICIRGYSVIPIYIFVTFPYVLCLIVLEIMLAIPIACGVIENSITFKKYWLSRIKRTEVRQRLVALRPMGIGAGPYGYVDRSLPMEMLNSIVDYICSIIVTFNFDPESVRNSL